MSIISDHNSHTDSIEDFAKRNAMKLLDLARKDRCREEQFYRDGFEKGIENTLKDLPKWKKATEDKKFDRHVLLLEDEDRVVLTEVIYKDEYYIELDNLKTLPKDE